MKKRLAIIGCGSSGLITLKHALELLPDWEVKCFEKTDSLVGCWGNPYPEFVSTSTKFTTQFACYPICDASIVDDGGRDSAEFFCGNEYGQYLESFADHFELRPHIRFNACVENLHIDKSLWQMEINGHTQAFDAVVICTGLAAKPKAIECKIKQLAASELNGPAGLGHIKNQNIVVAGGGESAVDYANRLSRPDLNNKVLLSLHSGVRVSPRYHPVRGVPSDFLRNRLMLSIDPDIRNWLGQVFVKLRIRYEGQFHKLFPGSRVGTSHESDAARKRRKDWTMRLTVAAKDDLFNMFHNKSDDFLEAVGEERIRIVGPPTDQSWTMFRPFDEEACDPISFTPDLLVPAIGYQSVLKKLTGNQVSLGEFHLGCCHVDHANLFLVGFARPIIGNVPTISEMQARLVCSTIARKTMRPARIKHLHESQQRARQTRYSKLNLGSVYPVEMFPYCDRIAKLMGLRPGPRFFKSPLAWWRTMTSPATTMHYFQAEESSCSRYMPATLVLILVLLKPVDWAWRLWKRFTTMMSHGV